MLSNLSGNSAVKRFDANSWRFLKKGVKHGRMVSSKLDRWPCFVKPTSLAPSELLFHLKMGMVERPNFLGQLGPSFIMQIHMKT